MKRVKPGAYTFNTAQSAFNLYLTNNILLDDSETGVVVDYTTAPLSGITTDKYVLAVDRPDDTQRYTLYAYETTTAGLLSIEAGWYWFNETTSEFVAIDAPTILLSAMCTILNSVSSDQINAMFTEPPIEIIKEYRREFWEGQRDTNMTDFEALSNVNSAISYNIVDYPNAGITNEQMNFALTAKRLFTKGETFICLDNGAYTKGHIYKINIVNGIKSWEDITPVQPLYKHELVIPYSFSVGDSETVNGSVIYHYLSNTETQITDASAIGDDFSLSGGIGKNSVNTVLLFNVNVIKAGSSITVEAVDASTTGYITGTVGTITDTVTQLI